MLHAADVVIVGGGIVGLATGYQLLQHAPGLKLRIIEKESRVAAHQTGHNSGVIHSGIYYRPGSLRAINCRAGKSLLEEFCQAEQIPYDRCGKVIVATSEQQLAALEKIHERGLANGVECRRIDAAELKSLEPHCAGVAAIHVPETGIVDYKRVATRLAELIVAQGGIIECDTRVTGVRKESTAAVLKTTQGERAGRFVVTCAGLQSDRVARLCGWQPSAKIVPFRGEYYELRPRAGHLCRNLIYPVPDPRFPFLGVHFTRMIGGGVECGPNAVWAIAREGYKKAAFNLPDFCDAIGYGGFRRLGQKYWRMGLEEMWRSWSKRAFVKALQRLVPEIRDADLVAAPAGVRAQAVTADGTLVDDFLIETDGQMVHVLNAPSPAATASLQIGKTICGRVVALMDGSAQLG